MAGWSTTSNDHLIRSNLWSTKIKEVLEDELLGMRYVDMISDFPDGREISIAVVKLRYMRETPKTFCTSR